MNDVVVTEIVDLNKKPEPKPEQTEGINIVQGDPSHPEPITIEPLTTEQPKPTKKPQHGYIVWRDSQAIKNIFKLIHGVADECTFVMTPNALTLRIMDPSRVAMIDLVLPKEQCEEFTCLEDLKFCFNVESLLNRTLKNTYKDEAIRFDVDVTPISETMRTRLIQKLTRNFTIPLLEASAEEIPTPKITLPFHAKLVLENLNTLFKDLEDHVVIKGNIDGVTFEQNSDYEMEKFSTTLQKGDETVLDIRTSEPEVKATFSCSYLKEILKLLNPLTTIITLSFGTNLILEIDAEIVGYGAIRFYLAPRIETED